MDNSATPRYCAFVLGALLHDIGKLVERAKEGSAGQEHTYSGEKWFEANLDNGLSAIFDDEERQIVRSATSSHHKGLDYISLADSTAVGMDQIKLEDEEPVNSHADALTSVFSYVSLSHKVKSPKYHRVEWLGSEGLEELFPVDNEQSLQPRYSALLDGFNREIRTVRFGSLGPLTVIDAVYFLLWKYAWCVPSGDKNEPGVSLFDHLRITAALTSCLYTYHQGSLGQTLNAQSAAFSLIGGDVSGIQGYIFDVLTQQGKVAKRLRSRSFFVQLIAETAAHKVLHAFALPLSNLVMSAGGNFYILAPNTQDGHAKIEALQKEFDEWTLDRLNGELNVNLAATKISGSDMADFSKVLDAIRFELTYRKNQPHKSALVSGAKWLEEKFLRPEVIQGDEKICQSCRKRPRQEFVSNAENLCECCLSDTKLGQMLPKSKYLAFFRDAVHEFKALNYSGSFSLHVGSPVLL